MYKYGDIVKVKLTGESGKVIFVDELLEQAEIEFKDESKWVFKFKYIEPSEIKLIKVVLSGKMRSGKDTVADYLIKEFGFKRFAFGDELKRYYHELFGNTEGKPREGYQKFGQLMRQFKPDVWVDKCFDNIINYPLDDIVITDLRQPNEYERCKKEGYIIIKVECDDEIRLNRMNEKGDKFTLSDLNHETESYIDSFEHDFLIENNLNVEHLHNQVDQIMSKLNIK